MIIKRIKILKSKVSLAFDNGEKLSIDKEIYPNFYLYEGKDISSKELRQIQEYNNNAKLLQYALKIRSKALYSEYSMREKLYKKDASKRSVDHIIKVLKSYNLIDDLAYAQDLQEYYNSKLFGENKIRQKISDKGIFDKEISKLKFSISLEREKANKLLPKLEKKYEKYNHNQKKAHIYKAYIDYGYNPDIASNMVNKIKDVNDKEELAKLKNDYNKAKIRLGRKYQKKELKQKIINSLLSKGYKFSDILKIME